MTPDDLIATILSLTGLSRDDLLYALLTIAALAPVISWLRPRVDPVLARWRDKAARTRTTADDTAVRILAAVWGLLTWLPAAVLAAIPVFASADEVDELQRKRRTARLLEARK